MTDWEIIPQFQKKGVESLAEADVRFEVKPGSGPKPGFFTVDVYPVIDAKFPARHFGTWQFSFDDMENVAGPVVSVDTDGVRLVCDGRECSPTSVIPGQIREDGSYTVYLVLSEKDTSAKLYETSYYRLLSFSGAKLAPVRFWPNVARRFPKAYQPEYWMMRKLRDAVKEFADGMSSGAVLLDYGGGCAPYYPYFADRGVMYVNADITHGQFVDVVCENGGALPLDDENYDAIMCTHVLEHTPEPQKIIAELYRVLKTGGRILAAVPNAWEEHNRPKDYWRFGIDGMRELFRNFRDINIRKDANSAQALIMLQNTYYYRKFKSDFLRRLLVRWNNFRYRMFAARCSENSLTCNYIFTAKK